MGDVASRATTADDPLARLADLGLELPPPWSPGASLLMSRRHGDLLYLSGHMGVAMAEPVAFQGRDDHRPLISGRIGADIDLNRATEIARGGALNLIATLAHELDDLRDVSAFLRLTVMINAEAGFYAVHKVADAVSDVIVAVFGDAGRHTRSSFAVAGLPANSCLAVDGLVALRGRVPVSR